MRKAYQALGRFEFGLAAIGAGICLFVIMMITVLSVFGRYALHMDLIPGAYNIIERMLFPLVVFWGLPLAHREAFFPRLEAFTAMMSVPIRSVVGVLMLVVELVIFLFLLWYMLRYSITSLQTGRTMQLGSGYFPVWPFIMMVPLAIGLMAIETIWQICRHILYFAGRGPAPASMSDPLTGEG
ncbi:TRAP transporter small permease [Paracoccus aerodenitrificans]|uniref:TRAP transporter small permease n=1 Tax=Paracoccus aerodenitrificans TaxID=3017781 RepID=UPI0022F09CD9|nr:TRAP transporter small permease [Paracoccus aerodenitrificans]WBU62746.1 TRAP transporter small permease [Paracoccus aerodenitrificans]